MTADTTIGIPAYPRGCREVLYSDASARVARWFSSPELLVVLLNAARRMGNISLTERIWQVATEEEGFSQALEEGQESQRWLLPQEAYTIMLQAYRDEARAEVMRRRRRARTQKALDEGEQRLPLLFMLDLGLNSVSSGVFSDPENQGRLEAFSRATMQERTALKQAAVRSSTALSWRVYKRMATVRPDLVPDARFFNAALAIFHRYTDQRSRGKRGKDVNRRLRKVLRRKLQDGALPEPSATKLKVPDDAEKPRAVTRLAQICRDMLDSGHPLPLRLRLDVVPAAEGMFRQTARSQRRGSREEQLRSRPPLVDWLSSRQGSKQNYSLSAIKDRSGILKRSRTWKKQVNEQRVGQLEEESKGDGLATTV